MNIDAIIIGLLLFVIGVCVIWAIWGIWWTNFGGQDRHDKRLEEKAKVEKEKVWLAYCERLHVWFKANEHCFLPSELNQKQQKILYALAQHLEFSQRVKFWQVLMLWSWDGTCVDRLRFDVDFEKIEEEGFFSGTGHNRSLPEENRDWYLTKKGRDFLLKHQLI